MSNNLVQVISAAIKNIVGNAIQVFLVAKRIKNFHRVFLQQDSEEKKSFKKIPITLIRQSINAIREITGQDKEPHIPGNVTIGTQAFTNIQQKAEPQKSPLVPERRTLRSRFRGGTARKIGRAP